MGEFRFVVPVDWNLDPYHANAIHIVGIDGTPSPCRIVVNDDADRDSSQKLFSVIRNREESGQIYVIYPFATRGEMLICTGTLPVNIQPYDLLTELARGTLNRLRNQISIWKEGGLSQDDQIGVQVGKATEFLGQAIHGSDFRTCVDAARRSLESSMAAVFDLSDTFSEQVSKFRRENDGLSKFWLANAIGSGSQRSASRASEFFDLVEVCPWGDGGDNEPEGSRGLAEDVGERMIGGPWLDASIGGMRQTPVDQPDFQTRKNQLLVECRQQLEQLPSNISLLHVVSGVNGIGHRQLSYPQQLDLTVELLRLVDDALVEVPTMVSFDFPWGERLAGAVGGVHSLQIADSLVRQGLQISFLGLDLNLDYWPNGSVLRDPLQWIDLVDVWAQLGIPLVLCLRAPSGAERAENEQADTVSSLGIRDNRTCSNVTDEQRIGFLKTVLPMMVARPFVHGLIWRQWQDQDDLRYPKAGFVDVNGNPKLMAEVFTQMRIAIGE